MITGVGVVEVTADLDSFDFSPAARWELLVLHGGEPAARLRFPSPGRIDSAALARELIWPHAEGRRQGREIAERLRRRSPAPARPAPPAPSCSVVLCTHGRPRHLAAALDALAALDPAPLEVIVVDNAPGELDCREAVQRRGFRYLREDRRGLDNARNAAVRAARGEVLAFTDDDCVPPSGWLRHLAESFANPLVAAVTGPAFPYQLDTPAQVRMELQASLTRGMRRRVFDWTLISPMHAGQAGAGANMLIRAELLRAVPEPFPPELDAGTETMSGGDTYVFARLLAAGHRIVYDPRTYVFHLHRADWATLERAVTGYGTGVGAALLKLLAEDGELEAPRAALWLVGQYLRTQGRRVMGRADAIETRISWSYLRGGLAGPAALRRARRTQLAIDPGMRPAPPFPGPTAAPAAAPAAQPRAARAERATVSVVVPTVGRHASLARCLAALEAQTVPAASLEVIVVDDSPGSVVQPPAGERLAVRVHRTGGRGAAQARNEGAALARGELLLFLDDDLVASPDLVERHVAAHTGAGSGALVVIGYSPPRPVRANLASLGAALWWEDHFHAMGRSAGLTFTDALSGNVSIRREAFLDGRRFDLGYAQLRREDWAWGYELLDGGAELRFEPGAVAAHEYELTAAARLQACRLEGRGDAKLAADHPDAAFALPFAQQGTPGWRHPLRRLAMVALAAPRADPFVLPVLALLERARLRSAWAELYSLAQRAAYAHGLRAAGWSDGPAAPPPLLEVELTSDDPLPRPGPVAPRVLISREGRPLAELDPRDGPRSELLERLAEHLGDGADGRAEFAGRLGASVTVLLGPGRRPGDDRERAALLAAGARVEHVDGDPTDHWERVLEAAETVDTGLIAIPLPGRAPTPAWLAEVVPAFESPLVELALGGSLPSTRPREALSLHDRAAGRLPYQPPGGPVDYLVLRPAALGHLRRAAAAAPYGPMAVAFACAEEVLAGGGLVAHRNTHGLDSGGGRWPTPEEQQRARLTAWGALLAASARDRPRVRGAAWLAALLAGAVGRAAVRGLRGGGTPLSAGQTGAALAAGYAAALRRR